MSLMQKGDGHFMKEPCKIGGHWLVIMLLIGFAGGAVFGQWYARENFRNHWKKGGVKEFMMDAFSKQLHLSEEQKIKVAAIFDDKHPQMVALQAEMQPKFQAIHNAAQMEIRAILNPDQMGKFDEMNAKMEEHWKQRQRFFSS